ncbi:metal-dependent phosphohydrolase [Enterococcus saigonensis]|uniref:Metal-dependent phosphohydrolase n=1 Tax=Enterococcus saigonensis TaxID=1805431 RepID=A0A679ICA3_9ENTE|nr:HD domain-containing protein [Enterococcus saigonensis]BCA85769.1 metal-dependent phosphohydrolase [Enterococcus saigonensis]
MDKITRIIAYAKTKLQEDLTGHGFDHAQRVATLAHQIAKKEKAQVDEITLLASAYLHDTIDDKVVPDVAEALAQLQMFLAEIEISAKQQAEIIFIITHMSFSKELEEKVTLSTAGKIVQDADRLEALGAMGILRTAYFGGSHQHPLYDPAIKPVVFTDKTEYRKGSTVINHFYEKLFLLPKKMNTKTAYEEALRRQKFMETFLTEFYQEWEPEKANFF